MKTTEMHIFASVGPFSDELIFGDYGEAIARLEKLSPLEAVQLVLATFRRSDSVVGDSELDGLAEAVGVFEDDE